ncbi:Neurogenic locus notch protein 1 [Bulinus truncatus]|nr:Neurogenic locus notch protein 1 [Bulinus truncatus]
MDIITAQTMDIITAQTMYIITAQTMDIITAQAIDIITAQAIDIITAQAIDIITAQTIDIITAQTIDIITTQTIFNVHIKTFLSCSSISGETGSKDKRCVKRRLLSISDIDEHEVTFNIIATKVQRSTDTGNQMVNAYLRLMHVCIADNVQIVKILLKKGANINATDLCDYSPLILAAQYSRDRVVSTLLQDCADVNKISDVDGKNALIVAIECNSCDIVNTLLWYGANVIYSDPLHRRGTTALILAARLGYRDIVEALIDFSADIDMKNLDGQTATSLCSSKDILKTLM